MSPILKELIEAAKPFASATPSVNWPCHAGSDIGFAICRECQRVLRLQRAIRAAESAKEEQS